MAFENLTKFFEKVKTVGFIERIFFWRNVVTLSYDAYEEFKSVDKEISSLKESLQESDNRIKELEKDLDYNKKTLSKVEKDFEKSTEKNQELIQSNTKLEKNLSEVKKSDANNLEKIQGLEKDFEKVSEKNEELVKKNTKLEKEISEFEKSESTNQERIIELQKDVEKLSEKNEELVKKNTEHEKTLAEIKKVEKKQQEEYEHKITELNSLKEQMDLDRKRLQNEREEEIQTRYEEMKRTWQVHEQKVEQTVKNVCKRCQVEYIDREKTPFKGKPDNTIKIAGEYIIFDAKSPANDNLDNFPTYIKNQAESLKKYAKEKDVKKDIFLVIPFNTLDKIHEYVYPMGDYTVFVITRDSLEPIVKSLQKIEEYEFAEQLSPEDRDNICRIIGKFAHTSKRRIQIDNYFANEYIQILTKCNTLPDEFMKKSVEFEKSEKMNPPMEKRAKKISNTELKKDVQKVKQEASAKDISINKDVEKIEEIPLYKG